ncbi:hypothetical protein V8C42DRAFT_253466 [Trichoderma barbatum]
MVFSYCHYSCTCIFLLLHSGLRVGWVPHRYTFISGNIFFISALLRAAYGRHGYISVVWGREGGGKRFCFSHTLRHHQHRDQLDSCIFFGFVFFNYWGEGRNKDAGWSFVLVFTFMSASPYIFSVVIKLLVSKCLVSTSVSKVLNVIAVGATSGRLCVA